MTLLNSIEIFSANNIDYVSETNCSAINVTVCFNTNFQDVFSFDSVPCLMAQEDRPPMELESCFMYCNVPYQLKCEQSTGLRQLHCALVFVSTVTFSNKSKALRTTCSEDVFLRFGQNSFHEEYHLYNTVTFCPPINLV